MHISVAFEDDLLHYDREKYGMTKVTWGDTGYACWQPRGRWPNEVLVAATRIEHVQDSTLSHPCALALLALLTFAHRVVIVFVSRKANTCLYLNKLLLRITAWTRLVKAQPQLADDDLGGRGRPHRNWQPHARLAKSFHNPIWILSRFLNL